MEGIRKAIFGEIIGKKFPELKKVMSSQKKVNQGG